MKIDLSCDVEGINDCRVEFLHFLWRIVKSLLSFSFTTKINNSSTEDLVMWDAGQSGWINLVCFDNRLVTCVCVTQQRYDGEIIRLFFLVNI